MHDPRTLVFSSILKPLKAFSRLVRALSDAPLALHAAMVRRIVQSPMMLILPVGPIFLMLSASIINL